MQLSLSMYSWLIDTWFQRRVSTNMEYTPCDECQVCVLPELTSDYLPFWGALDILGPTLHTSCLTDSLSPSHCCITLQSVFLHHHHQSSPSSALWSIRFQLLEHCDLTRNMKIPNINATMTMWRNVRTAPSSETTNIFRGFHNYKCFGESKNEILDQFMDMC